MYEDLIDLKIEKLWRELGGVRFKIKGEVVLGEDWHIWAEGVTLVEIRKWFDTEHSRGIEYLESII